MSKTLSYEERYHAFGEELEIEFAETGADREHGFDPEDELYNRYEIYSDMRIREEQNGQEQRK